MTRIREEEHVIVLPFCHSVCDSVNSITDERGNGCRPNLVDMDKRWPSGRKWGTFGGDLDPRVDSGSLFHVLHHWGIGDFWTFVSISVQSTVDLYHTWRNDWRHNVLGQIRQTSGLIWKSVFESRITFGWNVGVGGSLHSLNALIFCCDDSWCCFWWHVFLYTFYRAMLCIARTICCRWSDDV